MQESLITIDWYAPTPIDSSKVADIIAALNTEKNMPILATDPYFFGKEVARNGRLALIADQLGLKDVATSIRAGMKTELNKWLTGANPNTLQYESAWGGICSKNGLANSGADFGNGVYNDHHFHYGYHIYAAAVIGKEDPEWVQTYSGSVMDLVRDYANPSSLDPNFPVTRCKDWYDGNSWASGITIFGDSKNQESTSESINSYYAIYLWGLVTQNTQMKDLGRVMLATEMRAAKKYWQMTTQSSVYPSPFSLNKVVGIVWSTN
jgi:endo-1,3(4)-beta-glucanase